MNKVFIKNNEEYMMDIKLTLRKDEAITIRKNKNKYLSISKLLRLFVLLIIIVVRKKISSPVI